MEKVYGEHGKEYKIGETVVKMDEEFIIATVLAIVGVLNQGIPQFDEAVSATASAIYNEITKPST